MIRLGFLRDKFKNGLLPDASELDLDRYTRAICLEMFGTIMFPDMSQSTVPVYYLDFLEV